MPALDAIADWPVPTAGAAVIGPSGVLAEHGDVARRFGLASVTKPLVARAVQIAIEEGVLDLAPPRDHRRVVIDTGAAVGSSARPPKAGREP
jgi:CubicO group peptidase (beta-lactamase class C family)